MSTDTYQTDAKMRGAFLHFLFLNQQPNDPDGSDSDIFSLAKLKGLQSIELTDQFLLQVQMSLFQVWIDKLRTTPPEVTNAVLQSLPIAVNQIEVLRRACVVGFSFHSMVPAVPVVVYGLHGF